ncbi:unnamed protein product [Acanthoscelides obtectus]|uniref:HTH CENPB-type domain-containing protein n=1 Tax=Acanthoscelides obtectus TaxID=200917 RepID=A0A9P0LUJ1_ACAOB|nr:unnamed protein product [Acanthoscelides obtectus]CAK1675335.1 Tigger transposable element-derived protein 2 [Acanthoscelides obtectus]
MSEMKDGENRKRGGAINRKQENKSGRWRASVQSPSGKNVDFRTDAEGFVISAVLLDKKIAVPDANNCDDSEVVFNNGKWSSYTPQQLKRPKTTKLSCTKTLISDGSLTSSCKELYSGTKGKGKGCRGVTMNNTMPTKYNRRSTSLRGQWTKEQLLLAIAAVNNNSMGVNEAARHFNVPATTLRRRKKSGNLVVGPQGPSACLGIQNENKIVTHIKKLQAHGFAPTREDVRVMAFKLAEQLQIKHRFNHESGKAGYDWLHSFLSRHPGLSVRKSEGVSLARAQGMRRKEVADYFKLLERVLAENQLFEKHSHIFNVDETGMQLNNKPGFVVAAKGSKNVASITAAEKGETITVISCFSAEGVYIPPTCIMKGKNKKAEYEDGLPPGSKVYMNEKSAYINSALFYLWLKEQFLPRKPVGTVILLLDGHGSHCNNIEMLEFASSNNIILVCLPSHTTQFLQPLDRGFFKSLKMNYYRACNLYIKNNPTRRLTRLQFGELLASAWVKSATVSNAVAAFKATGIVPFNPEAIPDEAFLSETTDVQDNVNNCNNNEQEITTQASILDHPQPGCSKDSLPPPESPPKNNLTPGKMLNNISPIPCTSTPVQQVRKRSKQVASILNSAEKSEADVSLHDSSSEGSEDECCRGCNEAYATTKKPDDWLKCIRCLSWYHETCSRYSELCNGCAKAVLNNEFNAKKCL